MYLCVVYTMFSTTTIKDLQLIGQKCFKSMLYQEKEKTSQMLFQVYVTKSLINKLTTQMIGK